jgi:hypothetical protein
MKKACFLFLLPMMLLSQGCAMFMACDLPVARPPEALVQGVSQARVDHIYGSPIAAGMSADNTEYIEQVEFVDGVPMGWKFARIFIHVGLDVNTFFLWEIPGTIIESCNATYPEYTYYLVYDKDNTLVRAIPADSEEGAAISKLPWVNHSFKLWEDCDGVNRTPSALRLTPEQR